LRSKKFRHTATTHREVPTRSQESVETELTPIRGRRAVEEEERTVRIEMCGSGDCVGRGMGWCLVEWEGKGRSHAWLATVKRQCGGTVPKKKEMVDGAPCLAMIDVQWRQCCSCSMMCWLSNKIWYAQMWRCKDPVRRGLEGLNERFCEG